ncbi:SPFH domain-containing protein [Streptomyces sp. NPDC050095]|uniref:SPFH domain-containing protein n=1 Tax=unclassified Streptomyces TaxID=2593676 RepID=UPI00344A3962
MTPQKQDDGPVERTGRSLPGRPVALVGLAALAAMAYGCWLLGWTPRFVADFLELPRPPRAGTADRAGQGALVAGSGALAVLAFGGLTRCRAGGSWVLTLCGRYRGTVRRTGLRWISPLMLRRRVDVRLRHWRSEPLAAVDAQGTALRVEVMVVWRVRDTARALFAVEDHLRYLREQIEAALARVLSQLPADSFHEFREGQEASPTLRDTESVGAELTRLLGAECARAGLEVFSAQPVRIEYAPEVADVMRRRRIAALEARHRAGVLAGVVDSVQDTVERLTGRGLVELDDHERNALVRELTVAFATADPSA